MQAGRHGLFRRVAARQIGSSRLRFPSLFDVDGESSRAATHVDAYEGVLSDAGSTPAASTILGSWDNSHHLAAGKSLPIRRRLSGRLTDHVFAVRHNVLVEGRT